MGKILVHEENNFYSGNLSGDLLLIYHHCVDSLLHGDYTVAVSLEMTEENQRGIEKVVEAIIYGCPELFFIEQSVQTSWEGDQLTLEFTNKYPGENIYELWEKLVAELDRISAIVNKFEKTYDKLNRINQYLCARVKPVSSTRGRYGDAYGALILKEARCEGFAKAAKLIMDRCDIQSIIARGEAVSRGHREGHAWIIANCDGTDYHFDFTWNATRGLHNIPGIDYMFLDDHDIGIEHFPDYDYPRCPDNSKTFWALNNGIIKYHSELSRIKIVAVKNNYIAAAKLTQKLTKYEVDNEVADWMRNELSAYSYGSSIDYSYNEALDLLVFYFIN